jgi:hypothetical protein
VTKEKTKRYRYIGDHAEVAPGGRPLGIGDFIELTDDEVRDPFFEDLLASERMIGVEEDAEHQASLAERRVSSRETRAAAAEPNNDGEEQ